MPTLELTYFNSPGRAEPVRIALHIAGLSFVDHRVDFPAFMALKGSGKLPLGAVPVLEVDGVSITQTGPMLRYVAHLGAPDLYPTDPFEALVVDSAIDTFNDTMMHALLPSFFEQDPQKKLALRQAFAAGPMKLACGYLEGLVARSGGPFLVGARMTIGDLLVGHQVQQFLAGRLDGITPDLLEPYPHLLALAAAYGADPRILAYRASAAARA